MMIRKTGKRIAVLAVSLALAALASRGLTTETVSADEGLRFEVTVTNLTRGQQFTPILVSSHKSGVSLFQAGQPASSELARVAEEGDTGPLAALLESNPRVLDVQVGGGLLDPGKSKTVTVSTRGSFDRLSVVAMLIPTNDGFFALNGVKGPNHGELVLFSPAYDAGSEVNDELCSSIPGPFFLECGGQGGGGAVSGGEEGFAHIHAGIHGIGDLDASERDWRNPVARISVRRVP
jgi:Spondin_N